MDNQGLNHIGIIHEFLTQMNFGEFPVNNDNPQWNNTRILKIRHCPSFMVGCEYITMDQFLYFFNTLPYAFVIIIRCENDNDQLILADQSAVLNAKLSNIKRPIIIFFESLNSCRILYKNYGINQEFMEIVEAMDIEAQQVDDFSSLMTNLMSGGYGFFTGLLMQTTLNTSRNLENIEPNTIEDLMENFAERNDFLCVRFLHLFDRTLRPNRRIIERILRDDFLNNNPDRLSAIYGHDFLVSLPDGYNLLLLAIALRNEEAADILIRSGINLNVIVNHLNAADLAYATEQFNILSTLIRFNSQYPRYFDLRNVHLAEIGDIQLRTRIIHETIADDTIKFETAKAHIIEAASTFPNLKFWYDLANKSAVTEAILRRKFELYQLLLEMGLYLGPYEDIAVIRKGLTELEQQRIANINTEIAQNLQRDYLLILRTNSLIWQHNPDQEIPFDRIDEAFEILDENEFIQPILQIVAASRDFRIIFDFNRTSIEAVDFTSHEETVGIFQIVHASNVHIYIGARDLLNEETKLKTIGTLAHELCHYAMLLTYDNQCKPYQDGDIKAQNDFHKITKRCIELSKNGNADEKEEIVALVDKYPDSEKHAEMIARPSHMMMLYRGSSRLEQVQNTYNNLFTDFTTRVIPQTISRISQVRENFYERIRLEHTYWVKKAKKEKIIRYSLLSAIVMAICIVIGLVITLNSLNGCTAISGNNCTWNMLNEREKNEILDTTIKYQGHNRTIRDITAGYPEILNQLTNKEIRNPKEIVLNGQKWKLNFEYFERKFTTYYDGYRHNGGRTCEYKYDYELNSSYIQKLNKNRPFYIITGEPLSGKSTELMNIEQITAQNNEDLWVSYLNLINITYENYEKISNWSITNLTNFLLDIQKIDQNSFEGELFKMKFKNGDVILFIDQIDSIFEKNEKVAENFFKTLLKKSNKNTELWFGTRSYSDRIEDIIKKFDDNFNSKYKLLPLHCNDRQDFLLKILNSYKLKQDQVTKANETINEILKLLESYRNSKTTRVDNIYLLKVIASHTAVSIEKDSVNLYEIIDEYIRKMNDFSESALDSNRNIIGDTVMLHILNNNREYPLKYVNMTLLIDDFAKENNYYKIPNTTANISSLSHEFLDKNLKLGFFKKNNDKVEFLSIIYFEYFVAHYIHDEFWKKIESVKADNPVFINKINFFLNIFWDLNANFPVVRRCIKDFVKDEPVTFDNQFRMVFEGTIKNFINSTDISVGEYIMELFKYDPKMVDILKQINSSS